MKKNIANKMYDIYGTLIEFEPIPPTEDNRGGFYAKEVPNTENMTEIVLGSDGKGYVSNKEFDDCIIKYTGDKNNLETINKTDYVVAINEVNNIAKKANKAVSFSSYNALVSALNVTDRITYEVGQSIYIQTLNVPDLWVYYITRQDRYVKYNYTTDEAFIEEMNRVGFVQIGYYYIAQLETQKVKLDDYDTSEEVDEKISIAIDEAVGDILGGAS